MATVQPSNNSELQLYRVLQRANLLQYFETFITQGGDDVQQLCEAGEDEFLEIMALVGMASKPLHVRRLQKALQEWVANPAAFEVMKKYPTHVMSMSNGLSQALSSSNSLEHNTNHQDYKITSPQSSTISTSTPWTPHGSSRALSPTNGNSLDRPSPSVSPQDIIKDVLYMPEETFSSLIGLTQPALLEHQISAIATAATLLAQNLPPFEPKTMPKKQISKEISYVMTMAADDPNRMAALRKYAAIYGRFDSKRKNDRPMSLHEISVNEAAAQLCSHFPALLTRREELFPLARQVVRDSGYQYSKGHSRAAEVLVQPKLEQAETIPSTSSHLNSSPLSDICTSETFNDLQVRK
ncbi:NGFI-A-binding protein 1 [Bulinus truncatus]|nr:NGFI-A-binding protein 1 [Bulinus truncatus]